MQQTDLFSTPCNKRSCVKGPLDEDATLLPSLYLSTALTAATSIANE